MTSTTAQLGHPASMEVMRNPYEMGTTLINAKMVSMRSITYEYSPANEKKLSVHEATFKWQVRCPCETVALSGIIRHMLPTVVSAFYRATMSNRALGLASIAFESLEHVQVGVEHGAIPKLVHLLRSSDCDVAEQLLYTCVTQEMKKVLVDACWALSHLSDGANDRIQAVIDAGVCPQVMELLRLSVKQAYACLKAGGPRLTEAQPEWSEQICAVYVLLSCLPDATTLIKVYGLHNGLPLPSDRIASLDCIAICQE
ncbi:hypothetical protein RJ640_014649 [Escallonia rubra]|uniref:Uncharacterized protein n=1 Tax=Escallonia rubra TaxID=112253 RepID=A0AA88UV70_9ASTE|nr:hypothetical protein RJ640_014649 [Escallonia rubra]